MALRIGNSTERKRSMEKFIRLLFLSALVFLLIAAGSIACKKGADEQADSQENIIETKVWRKSELGSICMFRKWKGLIS